MSMWEFFSILILSKDFCHFKMNHRIVIYQCAIFRKHLFFSFLIFLFVPSVMSSQNDLSVDDFAFACEKSVDSIEYSLLTGARAFVIEIEDVNGAFRLKNSTDFKGFINTLDSINFFLQKDDQAFISLIFKGDFNQGALVNLLKTKFSNKILFQNNSNWPEINDLIDKGIQIIGVFESNLASTSIEQVREKRYYSRFSSDPLDKLILFTSSADTDSLLYSNAFELWKSTGKAPNFIIAPKIESDHLKSIIDSLNRTRRFRGVLEYNGDLLSEISWINSPQIITPSKFSFPLTDEEMVLSPYKNGYRITPAEVIHHSGQNDAPRIFNAYDVDIKDKLVYDFSFENKVENAVEKNWDRSISKDVSYIKDSKRGHVLHFDNNDSFVDYSKENTLGFKTPISVSVWIKPDSIPRYMGVVGFGMAFSLKLLEGSPDFTMATIKDHIIEQPLKIDRWQHLVVVYNPKTTVEFFLDGKMIGEADAHDIIPSKQSLVIGNNIWGEQFYGSIDDLKIWDRGLSLKEINGLFYQNDSKSNKIYYIILGVFVLLVLCIIFLFKRKKSVITERKQALVLEDIDQEVSEENILHLFGNFQIDLISKKILSPTFSSLHKQLLSFIILSVFDEVGGVNTNKLTDTFWPGVPKLKAKENRNGNIRKLRKVLSQIDGLEVVFDDKKWHVKTSESFEVDIFKYIKLKESIKEKLEKDKLSISELDCFLDLLKKGNILQNTQTEWVDYFKNKISNEVESLLSEICKSQNKLLHSEMNIKIAKTILLFDNLNENALRILISELVSGGKHGLAKNAYLSFTKNYEALYAESFSVDYQLFAKK